MEVITSFSGQYAFLSNFYPRSFWYKSYWGASAEHHFQAAKAGTPTDRLFVYEARTASEAKRRGRLIKRRHDWDRIKVDIMWSILVCKFTPNSVLAGQLLKTGKAKLIEGNTWRDTFWGQCPIGNGENWLGRLLMDIRADLQRHAVSN